jgi:hypothetical protein
MLRSDAQLDCAAVDFVVESNNYEPRSGSRTRLRMVELLIPILEGSWRLSGLS